MSERIEVRRQIEASPQDVFAVLSDPQGHVAIDASGMLMSADGPRVRAAGDTFVVHMDRESLGDIPEMGKYDVTVVIETFEADKEISWGISGTIQPPVGHTYGYRLEAKDGGTLVTSFYDWSAIREEFKKRGVFPIISEAALSGTLGILDRTVRRGYPQPTPRWTPSPAVIRRFCSIVMWLLLCVGPRSSENRRTNQCRFTGFVLACWPVS